MSPRPSVDAGVVAPAVARRAHGQVRVLPLRDVVETKDVAHLVGQRGLEQLLEEARLRAERPGDVRVDDDVRLVAGVAVQTGEVRAGVGDRVGPQVGRHLAPPDRVGAVGLIRARRLSVVVALVLGIGVDVVGPAAVVVLGGDVVERLHDHGQHRLWVVVGRRRGRVVAPVVDAVPGKALQLERVVRAGRVVWIGRGHGLDAAWPWAWASWAACGSGWPGLGRCGRAGWGSGVGGWSGCDVCSSGRRWRWRRELRLRVHGRDRHARGGQQADGAEWRPRHGERGRVTKDNLSHG